MKTSPFLCAISCLVAAGHAQSPTFDIAPAVALGGASVSINYSLIGMPNQPYAVLLSPQGGPTDVLGERLYLGPNPILTLRSGVLPATANIASAVIIPAIPAALGLAIYGQAVVYEPAAPNGFAVSNGESSIVHGAPMALAVEFDDPAFSGFTGSYSQNVAGHIGGAPISYRTHSVAPSTGLLFPNPIQNPFNPSGAREQMVYRPTDIGATGQREVLTALRWFSPTPVQLDVFQRVDVIVGHTDVNPNYNVDPWSALPVAPQSGLSAQFIDNYDPNRPAQLVASGPYVIAPSLQRLDGYVPMPAMQPFAYDGTSSMLVEVQTYPDPTASGINGSYGFVMVQSSPLPGARCVAAGSPSSPLTPTAAATGVPDNLLVQLQFEFANLISTATSPYYSASIQAPNWETPIVAANQPNGTFYRVLYRGSTNGVTPATIWWPNPDIADGMQYLQFRIQFEADLATGEVPLIDTLVVPYR